MWRALTRPLLRPQLHQIGLRTFCTSSRPQSQSPIPQDWEYCRMISGQIRKNNLTDALHLLIQSYLNKRVLDMQIYNSLFEKFNEMSYPLSYLEIVYRLYRDHFPPHPLIQNWMQKMTHSEDEAILKALKEDYEKLGIAYPVHLKSRKERIDKVKEEINSDRQFKSRQQIQQEKKTSSRTPYQREDETPRTSSSNEPVPDSQPLSSTPNPYSTENPTQQQLAGQLRGVIESLSEGIGSYNRVIVKGLEIEMDTSTPEMPHDQDMLPDDEQYDGGDISPLMGLEISKIKIERIEFYNDHQDQQGDSQDSE